MRNQVRRCYPVTTTDLHTAIVGPRHRFLGRPLLEMHFSERQIGRRALLSLQEDMIIIILIILIILMMTRIIITSWSAKATVGVSEQPSSYTGGDIGWRRTDCMQHQVI
jgi:hypothetical protein